MPFRKHLPRENHSIIHMGNGDKSAIECYKLEQRLRDCFSNLSALQQGIDEDDCIPALEAFVCDIAMALLGKEIEIKEEPKVENSNMTEDDLWRALNGMCAYDTGCVDSGIYDESLRQKVKKHIQNMSDEEWRLFISRRIRDTYLSEEALALSYGLADVFEFCRWLESVIGCGV